MPSAPASRRITSIALFALAASSLLGTSASAATSGAAQKPSGTLTVSGVENGQGKLLSCKNAAVGTTLEFQSAILGIDVTISGPPHAVKNVNMATSTNLKVFFSVPGLEWFAGYGINAYNGTHATHQGSGTVTSTTGYTSGNLNVKLIAQFRNVNDSLGNPIHLVLSWRNCPAPIA